MKEKSNDLSDLLGQLENLVELLKQGFRTLESPILSLILENLKDILLTSASALEDLDPDLRVLRMNPMLTESKILQNSSDPLIYERDELGNPRSIRIKIPSPIINKPDIDRLVEYFWSIYENLIRFQKNPSAQFLVEQSKGPLKSTKLSRKQYWYLKRKRNAHRNSRKV